MVRAPASTAEGVSSVLVRELRSHKLWGRAKRRKERGRNGGWRAGRRAHDGGRVGWREGELQSLGSFSKRIKQEVISQGRFSLGVWEPWEGDVTKAGERWR